MPGPAVLVIAINLNDTLIHQPIESASWHLDFLQAILIRLLEAYGYRPVGCKKGPLARIPRRVEALRNFVEPRKGVRNRCFALTAQVGAQGPSHAQRDRSGPADRQAESVPDTFSSFSSPFLPFSSSVSPLPTLPFFPRRPRLPLITFQRRSAPSHQEGARTPRRYQLRPCKGNRLTLVAPVSSRRLPTFSGTRLLNSCQAAPRLETPDPSTLGRNKRLLA